MTKIKTISKQDKVKALKHVLYEFESFFWGIQYWNNILIWNNSLNRVLKNSLHESVCIHARNLNEFFKKNSTSNLKWDSVICAADFGFPYIKKGIFINSINIKLNKEISHLKYERIVLKEKTNDEKERKIFQKMYTSIRAKFYDFYEHLCKSKQTNGNWDDLFKIIKKWPEDIKNIQSIWPPECTVISMSGNVGVGTYSSQDNNNFLT